jgi:hypothetical protein
MRGDGTVPDLLLLLRDPSLYDNVIEDMDDFHDPTLDFNDHDNPLTKISLRSLSTTRTL